jgi:hypothetical protein
VSLLRFNKGFDELDESFSGSTSAEAIGSDADLADADKTKLASDKDVSDGEKTAPIEEPERRKYRTAFLHIM